MTLRLVLLLILHCVTCPPTIALSSSSTTRSTTKTVTSSRRRSNFALGLSSDIGGGGGVGGSIIGGGDVIGGSAVGASGNIGGGGDDLSKALQILHEGAMLLREFDSKDIDSDEVEREANEEIELQKQERHAAIQGMKEKIENTMAKLRSNITSVSISNSTVDFNATRAIQDKLKAFDKRARKTRIVLLKKLAAWAFEVSDLDNDGKIDRAAFYSGTLLVHLHLAKYVGVAACQPPNREQINELFTLADVSKTNYLNKEEFTNAVVVATAPMTSRIATYWSLLAILPVIVARTMAAIHKLLPKQPQCKYPSLFQQGLGVIEFIIQLVLSRAFFSILVPNIFNRIDRQMRTYAYKRSTNQKRRNELTKPTTTLWWLRIQPNNYNTKSKSSSSAATMSSVSQSSNAEPAATNSSLIWNRLQSINDYPRKLWPLLRTKFQIMKEGSFFKSIKSFLQRIKHSTKKDR